MAYSDKDKIKLIDNICNDMSIGMSLRKACEKHNIAMQSFYNFIDENEVFLEQYTRACENRADYIFEEALSIADKQEADVVTDAEGNEYIQHNVINRSRLMVDTRKWFISKMFPKKYGERLELAGDKNNPLIPDQKLTQEQIDKLIDKL